MELILFILGVVVGSAVTLLAGRNNLNNTKSLYQLQIDNLQRGFEQQTNVLKQNYEQQLSLFKEQVVTTTEQLLKNRSEELQNSNTQQMEQIFKPLHENITKMERSMNENRETQVRNSSSFEAVMRQMIERTTTIGQQADRLSNALQHKNKTMGNWGELVLTDLLESQGLRKGYEYEVQHTMRDEKGVAQYNEETGSRMVPDVILHLSDNRDVIIDAKMSLKAFVDYVNATDDETREEAKQRHLESIRNHVRELATKDYSKYVAKPRISSDFVIMFVPNDGAVQLLMQASPEDWHKAFNKNRVFITGSQTLIAALHIIDLTWRQIRQERNTEKIMEEARKLVERVEQFYNRFTTVGKKLNEAAAAYTEVEEKVKSGKQSIIAAGRNIEELGVKGKKALPEIE